MTTNYFLVLGIEENAGDVEIEESFRYLTSNLGPANFQAGSKDETQAQQCLSKIRDAYDIVKDPAKRDGLRQELSTDRSKGGQKEEVRLGHLWVATGIISVDELMDAINRQTDIDLPLGELLLERQLLSQTELDGLLMGQSLYSRTVPQLDNLTQRLLSLSAISMDMVKIALIDQRSNMKTLPALLHERGWVGKHLLKTLESQHTTSGMR